MKRYHRPAAGFQFPVIGNLGFRILAVSLFALGIGIPAQSCGAEGDRRMKDSGASSRIFGIVTHLSEIGNRTSLEKQWEAAKWIEANLAMYGLKTRIEKYDFNGKTWPNVIAEKAGHDPAGGSVMLIAHLDSISREKGDAPGADDNGSGIAVLLEAARALSSVQNEKTIVFAAFSNEEHGAQGSRSFARKAKSGGRAIDAVINVDVVGYDFSGKWFSWDAIATHESYKYKAKSFGRMLHNYVRSLSAGVSAVKVVGRRHNGILVGKVSEIMQRTNGLAVRRIVDDDCG